MIFLTAVSCRKDKVAWTSDWVVPLINDTLLINDYVNDSTLGVNNNQTIQVIVDRNLIDLDLSSLIEIPDTSVDQSFSIAFPSIEFAPGSSFIDEVKEHEFSFEDIALTTARIKSGIASIRIENPVSTIGVFTISLPGVYKNGVEFSITQNVAGGTGANPGIGTLILDLSGYTIDMTGVTGQLYNVIQSRMKVVTDPQGPTVSITNQDVFKTKVTFEGLTVDYAKGYFGNIVFSDTTSVDLEALSKIIGGAINIEDINLEMVIRNGIKVRAKGQITKFESVNFGNNAVELDHPLFGQNFNIDPALGSWNNIVPSELSFLFDQSTGNMEGFLENLGSQYNVGYSIELNPLGNTSSGNDVIYPQSNLGIDLRANFPLLLGADNLTLRDTFEIDFKNDNKLLRIESGKLILNTSNSFPYGAKINLELLDETYESLNQITSTGAISPAQINVNGDGHVPIDESIEFILEEETADLLSETKFIKVTAVFNSTSFNNNTIYANAALKILLMSEFKLKTEL
ncbi:hypothetical protein [Brumimicrobium mesophilum]|uniref:hypothetical protein n=1 Tax=Brumimicrobium mesophilum TaxID=392717 RepID=UPI001F332E33|nr:hypothetical protein [Brumimicrobium mesophilum]